MAEIITVEVDQLGAEIAIGGVGDVSGPASSTNNAFALFDGTTGKLLKDAGYGTDRLAEVIGFGNDSVTATTTTRYLTIPGFEHATANTVRVDLVVTRAGTVRKLRVRHQSAGGNANAIVYTVHKNGVATALTVSIAANSTVEVVDAVNSFTVAVGDLLSIEVTKAAGVGTSPGDIKGSVELAA